MRSALLFAFTAISLAIATSGSAQPAPLDRVRPTGSTLVAAYGEVPAAPGYDYVRFLDGSGMVNTVGQLIAPFISGGFVDHDFTREYAIAYPSGDLYAIDASNAQTTPIGPTGLAGTTAGPRWDAVSGTSYATTSECGSSSTLYTIDVASGATAVVGSSAGTCIVAIAIEPSGAMYGVDAGSDALVSIDKSNGAVQVIGALGMNVGQVAGMDFDPSSGLLYMVATDSASASASNLYAADATTGQMTLVEPLSLSPMTAFALAVRAPDAIFADGFDGP